MRIFATIDLLSVLFYMFKFTARLKNKKSYILSQSGFTLIELLIVIVIISALAVTVFVALNPVKRTRDAREARRTSDIETILTAIHIFVVDNKGALPAGLTTGMAITQLGTAGAGCNLVAANVPAAWTTATPTCQIAATACVNLTAPLTPYLKTIPIDPKGTTGGVTPITLDATKTGYAISVDANNIVQVSACGGEGTVPITQAR